MKLRDWLLDLAENNYIDIIDGEVCILPIKEDIDDNQEEIESLSYYLRV